VIVAETLPHDIACWGSGGGSKGSYNYNPHAYLQFEICQGSNDDADYYWKAIAVAEEYCAHLCKLYGWTADNITSHAEAHKKGYASNHGDPISWMKHFGDSMDKFRQRVKARLGGTESPTPAPEAKSKEDNTQKAETAQKAENKAESVVYNMKTLRVGNTGTQVKVLQWLLNHTTDYTSGVVDGIFGTKTLAAVRQFQKANGLTVDGIVGKKTWQKLLG
jgi:N-acetylmuramoyl-L-alanine amidase CwlA